jgi:hypothetical protein
MATSDATAVRVHGIPFSFCQFTTVVRDGLADVRADSQRLQIVHHRATVISLGRAPRDAALRIDVFEVPDQQQPETDAGRQAGSVHRFGAEAGALRFGEIVEPMLG